jgi:large subunit ribosomal protein L23
MKPVATEKAVMLVESQNVITLKVDKRKSKDIIKKEVEEMFNVKVQKVRSLIKGKDKYVYVTLKKEFPAIDVATKLGLI